LENPGSGAAPMLPWQEHRIGGEDQEVMFLAITDLDLDGQNDVLAATYERELIYLRRKSADPIRWESTIIQLPDQAGIGKAVAVGDINMDGKSDIVFTCEKAKEKSGVMWLSYRNKVSEPVWQAYDISGPVGIKYDLVELLDLDGDGDLDVLTCEENTNLGVIWYENPTIR
jgi:hypothetical protein